MTHHQVFASLAGAGFHELLAGHDWVGADAGAEQFTVVAVMVVVGTLPDAVRGQRVNAENLKDQRCRFRLIQDGMVLMIVVDHKHAGDEQAAQHAKKNID